MIRCIVLIALCLLLPVTAVFAAECSLPQYESLLAEGKSAAEAREWSRSVEIYSRILGDCRSLVEENDIAKAYDALSFGQLMQEQYTAAIDGAKKCLEHERRYNACMMTAAKASEAIGDRNRALEYARAAVEVEPYDEYSAAVVIYARDFLKGMEKR